MGSGTTGMVAKQLGRDWLGTEASPKYAAMAIERIENPPKPTPLFQPEPDAPLFAETRDDKHNHGDHSRDNR